MFTEYWSTEQQINEHTHGIFGLFTLIILYSSTAVFPKVNCAAPWGTVVLPRRALRCKGSGRAALEVGSSQHVVHLFTIDVTFRPGIGKLVSLHQAHPSH
jgi:hypothetical protein